jgi:hypothetical protein
MPAAVIFDLDGVLLDSEQLWNRAKEALVRETGGTWHDDAPRAMMGMSSPEWSAYLHDELGVPLEPGKINLEVVARMEKLYREHLPLLPGAVDAVRGLAGRWPLGLASSSNREIIAPESRMRSRRWCPLRRCIAASRLPTCTWRRHVGSGWGRNTASLSRIRATVSGPRRGPRWR